MRPVLGDELGAKTKSTSSALILSMWSSVSAAVTDSGQTALGQSALGQYRFSPNWPKQVRPVYARPVQASDDINLFRPDL